MHAPAVRGRAGRRIGHPTTSPPAGGSAEIDPKSTGRSGGEKGDGRKKAGSEEPAKVAARHGFEPSAHGWEVIAAQFCEWLGLCGGVAGDAQTEAGKLALDVLAAFERERGDTTLAARPRLTGGDEARGLGGEERGRSCDGVSSADTPASGEGSLCGSGRVPLPSGEGEGARGEWSDFVRGGGNEKGHALAGRAGASREPLMPGGRSK